MRSIGVALLVLAPAAVGGFASAASSPAAPHAQDLLALTTADQILIELVRLGLLPGDILVVPGLLPAPDLGRIFNALQASLPGPNFVLPVLSHLAYEPASAALPGILSGSPTQRAAGTTSDPARDSDRGLTTRDASDPAATPSQDPPAGDEAVPSRTLPPAAVPVAIGAGAAFLLPVLWWMYSRIRRDEHLENPTRARVYQYVLGHPGSSIQDVTRALEVGYTTATYHLSRLEKAGYVVRHEEGVRVAFYQNGATRADERALLKIARNEGTLGVLTCILDDPGTFKASLAERLDVSHTTVAWHVGRLIEAGVIREERDGRTTRLYPVDGRSERLVEIADKILTAAPRVAAEPAVTA